MKKILIILLILLAGCYENVEKECDPEKESLKQIVADEEGNKECIYCNESGFWEKCEMSTVTVTVQ